jgi:cyclin B
LIEWLIDVHRKFKLLPETLYVTVSIIDRYLAKKPIEKKQLHVLGIASLLISTKYEEIYPPELKEILKYAECKFTKEEVLALEFDVLSTLEFNFFNPSALRFLQRYRKLSNTANDDQVFFFAQYLCEISLLDAFFLKHKPS